MLRSLNRSISVADCAKRAMRVRLFSKFAFTEPTKLALDGDLSRPAISGNGSNF